MYGNEWWRKTIHHVSWPGPHWGPPPARRALGHGPLPWCWASCKDIYSSLATDTTEKKRVIWVNNRFPLACYYWTVGAAYFSPLREKRKKSFGIFPMPWSVCYATLIACGHLLCSLNFYEWCLFLIWFWFSKWLTGW